MTLGRSALRTSDRFMITAEAEAFRPACAALPVAFFLRESADAEVAAVAAAGEPLRAAECAVAVVRSPEAGLAGSVAASVPAPGSLPDDCSAPADSVLDDCSAALQADDHSAPEALLAGCSAPLELAADDLVRRDCSERAGSAADDSARGGLAPADYSAQADSPDDSPADCWVGSPGYWTAGSPDGSRLAPRACLRPRLLLEADSQPDVREPFSASPDEAEVDLDAPPTAAAGPRKPAVAAVVPS